MSKLEGNHLIFSPFSLSLRSSLVPTCFSLIRAHDNIEPYGYLPGNENFFVRLRTVCIKCKNDNLLFLVQICVFLYWCFIHFVVAFDHFVDSVRIFWVNSAWIFRDLGSSWSGRETPGCVHLCCTYFPQRMAWHFENCCFKWPPAFSFLLWSFVQVSGLPNRLHWSSSLDCSKIACCAL